MPLVDFETSQGPEMVVSELHSPVQFSVLSISQPWDANSYIESVFDNIPASFFSALADFHSGRVVDLDTALSEPPPNE